MILICFVFTATAIFNFEAHLFCLRLSTSTLRYRNIAYANTAESHLNKLLVLNNTLLRILQSTGKPYNGNVKELYYAFYMFASYCYLFTNLCIMVISYLVFLQLFHCKQFSSYVLYSNKKRFAYILSQYKFRQSKWSVGYKASLIWNCLPDF